MKGSTDMRKKRQIITLKLLAAILFLIPFFKPIGPCYYDSVNVFFQIWKVVSIIFGIGFLIKKNKEISIYPSILKLILFWGIYLISSAINRSEIVDIVNNAITSIILVFYIMHNYNKDNEHVVNTALTIIFKSYIILHIASVFFINIFKIPLFSEDVNTIYFLGSDNYSAFSTLPMIAIILYNGYRSKSTFLKRDILLLIALTITYIFTKSYTASFSFTLFTIFTLLLVFNKNILKILSVRKVLAASAIVLILVLLFNIQNLFTPFLENVIHKGANLNSRTIIWNNALDIIKTNPLLGMGKLSNTQINDYYLYGASHTHNIFLELLMTTGIIGSIIFLSYMNKSVSKVYKKEKTDKDISILILGLISYIILSTMDYYIFSQYQYCILGILYATSLQTKGINDGNTK